MIKSDGSVMVHADTGGFKPQNWMTPPTVIEEEDGLIVVRKRAGATEDRLDIRIVEVRLRRHARHGRGGGAREGRRRAPPAGGARRRAAVLRRGLPARAARVADRHRPGRPDVPRRGRRLDRRRDQARRDDRRGRAADALPRADPRGPGDGGAAAACSSAQQIKPQARTLAESRGIACVEVDLAVVRGEREPDLVLFG